MHKAKQFKHQQTKTPIKKSVNSSHSMKPADKVRKRAQNQPHSSVHHNDRTADGNIEIIAVTRLEESSHNLSDIKKDTISSDNETDYEEVDSNYTESSAEEENDFVENGYV